MINAKRSFEIKDGYLGENEVLLLINRDCRLNDNFAVNFAIQRANELKKKLVVWSVITDEMPNLNQRNVDFWLNGANETKDDFAKLNIPFSILYFDSIELLSIKIQSADFAEIITDFYPLKYYFQRINYIADKVLCKITQIDSHNIVPARVASPKLEFGAYTIRPKIKKQLEGFFELPDLPTTPLCNVQDDLNDCIDESNIIRQKYNFGPNKIDIISGSKQGLAILDNFVKSKLQVYDNLRNDPTQDGQSGLSAYMNRGFIAPIRVAWEAKQSGFVGPSLDAFLEELIVRRELSDNFCLNNANYDNFDGFHIWAKTTLNEARADKREYLYSQEQFEQAKTHDPAWNAAQNQLVKTGKLHGYMRMYWAKKILEWTESPEEALANALYLNDEYALDGCDPNGFTGVAWSIGGVHDRAWTKRPVFGKIRFMNYAGLKRKFDIKAYEYKFNLRK